MPWTREEEEGTQGVRVSDLFGTGEGACRVGLHLYEIQPGGQTAYHAHVWEHQVYLLEGTGTVRGPEGDQPVGPGDAVLVPAGEPHQFLAGPEPMRFLSARPLLTEEPAEQKLRAEGAAGGRSSPKTEP
jgi:quercetin dioxygenase-like cupin family protein